jgi:hypothetical protein
MGFFKRLFGGGSRDDAPDETLSPWQQKLSAAKQRTDVDDRFWDFRNAGARELVVELLTDMAPSFESAKIKEDPDDRHIDLRGYYEGAPVRFTIWMRFGKFWRIAMRSSNPLGTIDIARDHDKIPKEKDPTDPWSENEERRVFLGKGIFVEGHDPAIEETLSAWSRLPDALRTRILEDMERLDMDALRVYDEETSLHVEPGLDELDDPIAYMTSCAELLASIKDAVSDRPPGAEEQQGVAAARPSHALTCAYCSSLFILAAGHNTCPNCGAPARPAASG